MLEKLKQLQKNSYSPYSNFKVAAILITKEGNEYNGVNVENAGFGPSNCAERSALFSAISQGEKPNSFKEIHIIGGEGSKIVSPCGICRQVISELMGIEAYVYQYSSTGDIRKSTMKELLPFAFEKEDLNK